MSFWGDRYVQMGRPVKKMVYLFVLYFCGLGYLTQIHNQTPYFNEKMHINKKIIDVFFDGNFGEYILNHGYFMESSKHGLRASKNLVEKYIRNMPEFQLKKTFNEKKYADFLKKHKLTDLEIREYAYKKLTINLFKKTFANMLLQKNINNQIKIQNIEEIQGDLYEIDLEQIDIEPLTEYELKIFMEEGYTKHNMGLLTAPQTRSGFVVCVDKNTNIEKLEKCIQEIDFPNINLVKSQLDKLKIKYTIKTFSNATIKNRDEARFLFDQTSNLFIEKEYIYIPFVQHIESKYYRIPQGADLDDITQRAFFAKKARKATDLCLNISNQINKSQSMNEELKKYFLKSSATFKEQTDENRKFFKLRKGQSCVFENQDGLPSIFICNKKILGSKINLQQIIDDSKMQKKILATFQGDKQNNSDNRDAIEEITSDGFSNQMLNFWLNKFHSES